jgi:hypothetical protein
VINPLQDRIAKLIYSLVDLVVELNESQQHLHCVGSLLELFLGAGDALVIPCC